jgi:hypothetical protein
MEGSADGHPVRLPTVTEENYQNLSLVHVWTEIQTGYRSNTYQKQYYLNFLMWHIFWN